MTVSGRIHVFALSILGGDAIKVPLRTIVKDVRLVWLSTALKAAAFIYITVFDLMLFHRYASFETPAGFANVWATEPANVPTPEQIAAAPYCDNPLYNWGEDFTPTERRLTGNFLIVNASCVDFNMDEHTRIDGSSFNVVTFHGWRPRNESQNVESRFVLFPSIASFNVIHTFSVSWRASGTTNPRTIWYDASGRKRFEFAEGQPMTAITVGDVLDMVGVDLDERNVATWMRGGELSEQTHYRTTGVVVVVRMQYTNRRSWEMGSSDLCEVTVERLPQAWGWLGPQISYDGPELGWQTHTRNYVRLQFVISGSVGRFSATNVLLAFVQGVVLFNLASVLVNMAARRILKSSMAAANRSLGRSGTVKGLRPAAASYGRSSTRAVISRMELEMARRDHAPPASAPSPPRPHSSHEGGATGEKKEAPGAEAPGEQMTMHGVGPLVERNLIGEHVVYVKPCRSMKLSWRGWRPRVVERTDLEDHGVGLGIVEEVEEGPAAAAPDMERAGSSGHAAGGARAGATRSSASSSKAAVTPVELLVANETPTVK